MKSYVTAFFSRPLEFGTFCGCFKLTFFLPGKPLITEPLITNYDPLLIKHPTELSRAFLPPSHPLSTPAARARLAYPSPELGLPVQSWASLGGAEAAGREPGRRGFAADFDLFSGFPPSSSFCGKPAPHLPAGLPLPPWPFSDPSAPGEPHPRRLRAARVPPCLGRPARGTETVPRAVTESSSNL